MFHHLWSQSIIILIFLNIYCYSSPIPYVDQNEQDQTSSTIHFDEESMMKPTNDEQLHYYILCAVYNNCYNKDQQDIIYTDMIKPKRLTSSLFHGIPKFGKRAFVSAFSGIPKFG